MNQILFGLIGVLMLAITGLGFTDVKAQMENRAVVTSEASVSDETDDNDVVVSANSTSESSAESVTSVKIATTVPEVLAEVTQRVETAFFGTRNDNEEYEYEDEDSEEEDEDDEHSKSPQKTTQANPASAPKPSASTSVSSSTTFTMADIASHNSATSCYSAIGGSVYNLTSFVTKHPGGQSAIKSLCGVDGTTAFSSQHGGQGSPASILAQYKIGVVK